MKNRFVRIGVGIVLCFFGSCFAFTATDGYFSTHSYPVAPDYSRVKLSGVFAVITLAAGIALLIETIRKFR